MADISQIYDDLYNEAAVLLKEHSPCQITKKGKSCAGDCKTSKGLCCHGCKYLGPQGCTVQSLACKVWLCSSMSLKHEELIKKLEDIWHRAIKAEIPMRFRGSKEDNLNYLKSNSHEQITITLLCGG